MKPEKPIKPIASLNTAPKPKNLYQNDIKKPAINSTPLTRRKGSMMDISRSNKINHFATKSINKMTQISNDIQHTTHPIIQRVEQIRKSINKTKQPQSMQEIKNSAINEAMDKAKTPTIKKKFFLFDKKYRTINIIGLSLLAIIIVGLIVYFYIPSISVSIASKQAGINANFPAYYPDGYSLNGPITFSNGEVLINFKSNTNNSKFVIKQAKSSWDSSAVRNKVSKDAGGEFITTEEKGLTIFTYKGNAAWVNGGILYTINGDANLSGDQIRRIATSL
jgi:hypothetical protein